MFHTSKLKTKLIWSFTTIILISFLGITVCFYAYIHNFIEKDIHKSMGDLADSISSQLDGELYSLDRIALGMLGNKEFTDGLTRLNNRSDTDPSSLALEKYGFQKLVDKLIFTLNTPILTSPMISVIQPDHDYYFGWSIAGLDQPAIKSALHDIPWLSEVQDAQGAKVIIPPGQNKWTSRQDVVVSLTRAVMTTKGRFLGALEIQQSYGVIEKICASSTNQRLTVVIDAKGNLIYPLTLPWQDNAVPVLSGTEAKGELTLDGTKYAYTAAASEYSGWRTLILYPSHATFRNTALLFQFVFYSVIIILLISVTAVFIISEGLTKPLRELQTKIKEIDAGRLNIRFNVDSGDDEIHQLNKALEQMTTFYRETEAERIVVAGCGSSYSLSRAVASNLRILLGLPCVAVAGGDLMIHLDAYREIFIRNTLLITMSRSGATHEILYACRELRAAYPLVRILSVVCTERSGLASVSDAVLELPWAFDASVCQTRSVTNMLAAALYLFARLSGRDAMAESFRVLAEKGTAFQRKMEPALREIARRDWTNAMVLCDGETFGAAEEAALAFNEIAYVPSSCKHVLDVRHGPMILVGKNTLVLARLTAAGLEYERSLVKDLAAKGAIVVVLSDEELPALDGVAAQYSFGPRLDDAAGAMLILPAAQLSSYYKALERGLNPDAPEGLDAWIALK